MPNQIRTGNQTQTRTEHQMGMLKTRKHQTATENQTPIKIETETTTKTVIPERIKIAIDQTLTTNQGINRQTNLITKTVAEEKAEVKEKTLPL